MMSGELGVVVAVFVVGLAVGGGVSGWWTRRRVVGWCRDLMTVMRRDHTRDLVALAMSADVIHVDGVLAAPGTTALASQHGTFWTGGGSPDLEGVRLPTLPNCPQLADGERVCVDPECERCHVLRRWTQLGLVAADRPVAADEPAGPER